MAHIIMFVFIVIFVLSGIKCIEMEPQCVCSKYHYEEQVLEKMIRTEIKFEQLQRTVDKKLSAFSNRIENQSDIIETFKTNTDELLSRQQKKLGHTLNDMTALSEKILVPDILFKSRTLAEMTYNSGETVVFSDILYNYGDGYDKKTGIFTAPANGTYWFVTQLCAVQGGHIYFDIVVDGTPVSRKYAHDKIEVQCMSIDAIVKLINTSRVWIQGNRNINMKLYESASIWNTFSGSLIR